MISDRRLFLTATGEVVEDGDPDAATLLVGKGCTVDNDTARRLGLIETPKAWQPTPVDKLVYKQPKPESKAMKPGENKAIQNAPETK